MLTEEEAMMHPQSNVIIRSLGDATEKAKPDIVCHPIAKDEILLLCSDGLCGVCTDATIAEIIKQESGDLRVCKEKLTNAALEAEGSDNITISLLQIVAVENAAKKEGDKEHLTFTTWQNISFVIFALGLAAALGFAGLRTCSFPKNPDNEQVDSAKAEMEKGGHKDSIKVDSAKNKMQEDKTYPKGGKQTLKDRINDSKKDIGNSTTSTSEENSSSEPTPTDGSGTSSVTPVPITE